MNENISALLKDWHRRCRQSQRVQYECARHYSRMNVILGSIAILLSTLVGTAIFADFATGLDARYKFIAGLTSFLAAFLSVLQTFLRFSERAERHRFDSARYGALRRQLEEMVAMDINGETLEGVIRNIRGAMDDLAETSLVIPEWAKRRALKAFKEQPIKNPLFLPDGAPISPTIVS